MTIAIEYGIREFLDHQDLKKLPKIFKAVILPNGKEVLAIEKGSVEDENDGFLPVILPNGEEVLVAKEELVDDEVDEFLKNKELEAAASSN